MIRLLTVLLLTTTPALAQTWQYAIYENCSGCKDGNKLTFAGQGSASGDIVNILKFIGSTETEGSLFTQVFAALGKQGWELVTVNEYVSWDKEKGTRYIFKRIWPQPVTPNP